MKKYLAIGTIALIVVLVVIGMLFSGVEETAQPPQQPTEETSSGYSGLGK